MATWAVVDAAGKYSFGDLAPGTYCVSMNEATTQNGPSLLLGDRTFPSRRIWYQEIIFLGSDQAYPVNFGWECQIK